MFKIFQESDVEKNAILFKNTCRECSQQKQMTTLQKHPWWENLQSQLMRMAEYDYLAIFIIKKHVYAEIIMENNM